MKRLRATTTNANTVVASTSTKGTKRQKHDTGTSSSSTTTKITSPTSETIVKPTASINRLHYYNQGIHMEMDELDGTLNYSIMMKTICDASLQVHTVRQYIDELRNPSRCPWTIPKTDKSELQKDNHILIKIITRGRADGLKGMPYFQPTSDDDEYDEHGGKLCTTPQPMQVLMEASLYELFNVIVNRLPSDGSSLVKWYVLYSFIRYKDAAYLSKPILAFTAKLVCGQAIRPQNSFLPLSIRLRRHDCMYFIVDAMESGVDSFQSSTLASALLTAIACENWEALRLLTPLVVHVLPDLTENPLNLRRNLNDVWFCGMMIHAKQKEMTKLFLEASKGKYEWLLFKDLVKTVDAEAFEWFNLIVKRYRLGHKSMTTNCLLPYLQHSFDLIEIVNAFVADTLK